MRWRRLRQLRYKCIGEVIYVYWRGRKASVHWRSRRQMQNTLKAQMSQNHLVVQWVQRWNTAVNLCVYYYTSRQVELVQLLRGLSQPSIVGAIQNRLKIFSLTNKSDKTLLHNKANKVPNHQTCLNYWADRHLTRYVRTSTNKTNLFQNSTNIP